jgi:hypothetical protein
MSQQTPTQEQPSPPRPVNNSPWALTREEKDAVIAAVNKHCEVRDQHDKELAQEREQSQQPTTMPSACKAVTRFM